MKQSLFPWLAGAVLLLAGCPSGEGAKSADPGTVLACQPGTAAGCACANGSTSMQVCAADGASYGACACEGGTTGALPCDVAAIVNAKCAECHGATLNHTAPMHLVTAGDFALPSKSNASLTVAAQVSTRIHSPTSPMPPPTMPQLTAAEVASLDAWLAGGAKASLDTQCSRDAGAGGQGGTGGMEAMAGAGGDGAAGTGTVDPDVECYDFVAHANGTDAPMPIPNGTKDLYNCYYFTPPWQGDVQGVSFKSIVTNEAVVHHWLLYQNSTAPADGTSAPCLGAHPDAALLAGWAVGGSDTILPDDVGMQMGTTGFTLEIHYNNDGADVVDSSGVRVCVTKKPRTHLAGIHWLGTNQLNLLGAGTVTSTCTPNFGQGPINILSSWPHMHKRGTRLQSVIMRAGGGEDMLIDKPFDFNYQISYPTPQVLQAGDKIVTTCTYGSGPVRFGEGTGDEMCFNFVVAWPAGSLASFSAGNFTANQCFQ